MNTINLDFNKSILYKKKFFSIKNFSLIKCIKFSCFLKQNYVTNKKQLHTYYYNIFKQLENLFGVLPKVSNLNLKYTNKKKKLKTKLFIKIDIKTKIKDVFFFLEILLVKYFYFYLKSLEVMKQKELNILKETIRNKIFSKIKVNENSLNFNILFLKKFLNLAKSSKLKRRLFYKKYKMCNKRFYNGRIKFKVKLSSRFINYFFKLIKILTLSNFKIKILMHKKYMKYKKILEKA